LYAFRSTGTEELTITLGSATNLTAPTLQVLIFDDVTSPKTVTVRVPAGETWYGTLPFNNSDTTTDNWGNAFRGKGWNSIDGYGTGTVNSNVNLIITEYTP
jgi:hypothetical protein